MPTPDETRRGATPPPENDRILHRFLQSADPREVEKALEDLVGRAHPVIDSIVGYYRRRNMLAEPDAEDVASTVRMRLLLKLRRLAAHDAEAIATYDGYVARLTYNAVNDVFRGRLPQRAVLTPPQPDAAAKWTDGDNPLLRLERREDVDRLWAAIRLLPLQQRIALLLNLRSVGSGSAIALFVLLGVTTFDGLAAALDMVPAELIAIWSQLPLDDLTIAERLGVTRQQVINLRKSARKRLDRRSGRRAPQ
jgi:DNA-directed RNA polymerase specialized sigma24 family protein